MLFELHQDDYHKNYVNRIYNIRFDFRYETNVADDRVHKSDDADHAFLPETLFFPTFLSSTTYKYCRKRIDVGQALIKNYSTYSSC